MIIDDDVDITNLFKIFLECNGYNVDGLIQIPEKYSITLGNIVTI